MKNLYERYLKLIGLKNIPAGIDGLREIVRKHIYSVPFENVSHIDVGYAAPFSGITGKIRNST